MLDNKVAAITGVASGYGVATSSATSNIVHCRERAEPTLENAGHWPPFYLERPL